jgi:SAM-dependent methyltransferase
MHNILKILNSYQVALDLGCGGGSFNYSTYSCRIIGIDIWFNTPALNRDGSRIQYLQAKADAIPLEDHSVDAVFCHHTLEHFPNYLQTLKEVDRVLKAEGVLWIAVPNGYSFDDALYRRIFQGGGHLNRFTFDGLVESVQTHTTLKLQQSITLFSGFVYLKTPHPDQKPHFPMSARFLFYVPEPLNRMAILFINTITRLLDKVRGSRISQYGWGFIFTRGKVVLEALPSYFNVCWKCGSGHGAGYLRQLGQLRSFMGVPFFVCPSCQARSVFFNPPESLS